ncbi:Hypothetical protein UVM_LOCUS509 [uncultured virus]|nr:Hypothetical protein UVM_LOCUS509 [uncultured virus]
MTCNQTFFGVIKLTADLYGGFRSALLCIYAGLLFVALLLAMVAIMKFACSSASRTPAWWAYVLSLGAKIAYAAAFGCHASFVRDFQRENSETPPNFVTAWYWVGTSLPLALFVAEIAWSERQLDQGWAVGSVAVAKRLHLSCEWRAVPQQEMRSPPA